MMDIPSHHVTLSPHLLYNLYTNKSNLHWGNDPWTFCIWVMNIITIMIAKDFCQESLLATRFARCSWISKCYVCHVEISPVTIYTESFRGESRSSSFWDDAMNQWVGGNLSTFHKSCHVEFCLHSPGIPSRKFQLSRAADLKCDVWKWSLWVILNERLYKLVYTDIALPAGCLIRSPWFTSWFSPPKKPNNRIRNI